MGAIHIRNEMHIHSLHPVGAQGLCHHHGAQVGASDADVDDGIDFFAGVAGPFAAVKPPGKGFHALQHLVHFGHHILAVHQNRAVAAVAEGHMQHSAVFGAVDGLP